MNKLKNVVLKYLKFLFIGLLCFITISILIGFFVGIPMVLVDSKFYWLAGLFFLLFDVPLFGIMIFGD